MHARAHRAAASKSLDRSWNSYVCGHGVSCFLLSLSLSLSLSCACARIPSFYISFFPFSPSSKRIEREILAESWESAGATNTRDSGYDIRRIRDLRASARKARVLLEKRGLFSLGLRFRLIFNIFHFWKREKKKKQQRIATSKRRSDLNDEPKGIFI